MHNPHIKVPTRILNRNLPTERRYCQSTYCHQSSDNVITVTVLRRALFMLITYNDSLEAGSMRQRKKYSSLEYWITTLVRIPAYRFLSDIVYLQWLLPFLASDSWTLPFPCLLEDLAWAESVTGVWGTAETPRVWSTCPEFEWQLFANFNTKLLTFGTFLSQNHVHSYIVDSLLASPIFTWCCITLGFKKKLTNKRSLITSKLTQILVFLCTEDCVFFLDDWYKIISFKIRFIEFIPSNLLWEIALSQ